MKIILFVFVALVAIKNTFAQDEFVKKLKGCSTQTYKLALEEVEKESYRRGAGRFRSCTHFGFAQLRRTEIKFKEIKGSDYDYGYGECTLQVSTTYYCHRLPW